MKKWSVLVAGLYGLALIVFYFPVIILSFLPIEEDELAAYAGIFLTWQTWMTVGVMVTIQWALLSVPVALAEDRPVPRRSIWLTVLSSAFMMGLLSTGAVMAIYEAVTRDVEKGFWEAIALGLMSWLGWSIYFYRTVSRSPSRKTMNYLQRRLWTGSILELLIAIPTHIVARHRDYCCAGYMTFIGITCGFAVMVFAFGPALYFLFADRWKTLHPQRYPDGQSHSIHDEPQ